MAKNTKPMTKSEMIDAIADKTGFTKSSIEETYKQLVEVIAVELKKKGVFTLPNLGKFAVKQYKARMGRNPSTGEPMKIPAKKNVKCTVSKIIKDRVLAK